jgi:hypothetical protein
MPTYRKNSTFRCPSISQKGKSKYETITLLAMWLKETVLWAYLKTRDSNVGLQDIQGQ